VDGDGQKEGMKMVGTWTEEKIKKYNWSFRVIFKFSGRTGKCEKKELLSEKNISKEKSANLQ
jgi:hypothetical protein